MANRQGAEDGGLTRDRRLDAALVRNRFAEGRALPERALTIGAPVDEPARGGLPEFMISAGLGRVIFACCAVGCVAVLWFTRAAPGSFTTLSGAPIGLDADAASARVDYPPGGSARSGSLQLSGDPPAVRLSDLGRATVTVTLKDGRILSYGAFVVDRGWLYGALAVLAALVLVAPYAFGTSFGMGRGPWSYLLTEAGGGLSLGRVQFVIWVVPATLLYLAISIVGHAPAPIDSQLAILLGLSGATTTLGAASNPRGSDTEPETPPRLADLVQDWDGRPDLSRYQYLFLSTIASLVIVAAFFQNLQFPAIPTPILYLVAASQGTYVATKAVKTSREGAPSAAQGSADGSRGLVAVIGAAPSALRLGAGGGTRVDAPAGEATPDGSMVVPDAKGTGA